MTVPRPREAARQRPLDALVAGVLGASEPSELDGFAGAFDLARDGIVVSARASGLIRAGLFGQALIIDALLRTYRTLAVGGRTIVLEFGVYR